MPTESVRAIFERRKEQPFEPMLAGVTGCYRFDVQDAGTFYVSVDDGYVLVGEAARDADCVIACDEDTFVSIADGTQNLLTAAMQGRVEISGDLVLAQKLHGVLPAPRRTLDDDAWPEGQP